MKRLFFTGLLILMPAFLTLLILLFVINFLTDPFIGLIESLFAQLSLEKSAFSFLLETQYLEIISRLLILALFVVALLIVGIFVQHLFGHYLFLLSDRLIYKIPVINRIYKIIQDTIETLFQSENNNFAKAALMKFPHTNCYGIVFLSKEEEHEERGTHRTVVVPGTPNPTAGYILFCNPDELILLNTPVDQALKFVLSCGVMSECLIPNPNKQL